MSSASARQSFKAPSIPDLVASILTLSGVSQQTPGEVVKRTAQPGEAVAPTSTAAMLIAAVVATPVSAGGAAVPFTYLMHPTCCRS